MNAAALLNHFDRISEAPDAVARLRRFILDLAVRGKLVAQDPNDEPAAEFLKRIQAEKKSLFSKGIIRKEKDLPPITTDSLPFDPPARWDWVRLGNVKVDELMALCDQLEAQLSATETNSRRLLETVLRDALAPALEVAA